MKFRLIYLSSVSACFELENDTAYYAEKSYDVFLNDKKIATHDSNVFSVFDLSPDTEYEVRTSLSDFAVLFTTNAESYALSVKSFGAVGDGVTDDTPAVQVALDLCPKNGRIIFEKGTYLLSPIRIKSDTTVEIRKGATLLATTDEKKFPLIPGEITDASGKDIHFASWEGVPTVCHEPFIGIYSGENVNIVGEGVIDGNAQNGSWWIEPKKRVIGRPRLFFTHYSKHIYLHGVTGQNSPSWNFQPYFSKDIGFYDTKVKAPADSPNTDGLDPESCDGVEIIGMVFSVGDDAIAIKSGKVYMGAKYNTPAINHTIRNCKMSFAHGGVVLGSEMSGGVKNLKVERCFFEGTDRGLRIKTRRGRGKNAVIDGITFKNIKMDGVKAPFVMNMFYFCDPDGKTEYVRSKEKLPVDERTPYLGKFTFKDIDCRNAHWCAGYFYGLPEQPIESVTLKNVKVTFADNAERGRPAMMTDAEELEKGGFCFRNVNNVTLKDVVLDGVSGEKYVFSEVKKIEGADR